MVNFEWEGVMPAITTQFDAQGKLSLEAFKNQFSSIRLKPVFMELSWVAPLVRGKHLESRREESHTFDN